MFFFISPPDLRAQAGRRETLPHDRKLADVYHAGEKNSEGPHQKLGPKHAKLTSIFINFRL